MKLFKVTRRVVEVRSVTFTAENEEEARIHAAELPPVYWDEPTHTCTYDVEDWDEHL